MVFEVARLYTDESAIKEGPIGTSFEKITQQLEGCLVLLSAQITVTPTRRVDFTATKFTFSSLN